MDDIQKKALVAALRYGFGTPVERQSPPYRPSPVARLRDALDRLIHSRQTR
jgi:hypothetical protein